MSTRKLPFKNLFHKKDKEAIEDALDTTIGSSRSFASAEAHKRLRTNVLFSFSDQKSCHVIGITSAMAHEGKSTTAINLAYDMMQVGKKVLLIDADMRLSKVAQLLEIERSPGLSNALVGDNNGEHLIQRSNVVDSLQIISCGDLPPNPTELLASKRLNVLLNALENAYEYIIIDLPPITEVADALIVSKITDGMIVVVRQDFSERKLLDDTIRQLRMNEANIIGFVMTCAQSESKYYKNYKYKKYYSKDTSDSQKSEKSSE